ncbi:MAG: GNAT family N-acetyltransferase [Thermoplasmata archaeon]
MNGFGASLTRGRRLPERARSMVEVEELGAHETEQAYDAMQPLRPRVGTPAEFAERVNRHLRPEGYRLAVVREGGRVVSVAGFRVGHDLVAGKYLYLDDLSTHPAHRSRGHAGRLVDWLLEEARRLGCDTFELDSSTRAERDDAYRLYLNKRLAIRAMHFVQPLGEPPGPAPAPSTGGPKGYVEDRASSVR